MKSDSADMEMNSENIRKKKNPHPMLILSVIVVLCALLTYVIPAGEYVRYSDESIGRELIVPDSFTFIDRTPASPLKLLMSLTMGLQNSANVIFFLLIVGGMFAILNGTGALNIGIANLLKLFKGRELLLIPVMMLFFGIGSACLGNFEEYLVFVPLILACSMTAGFDSLTAVGIIFMAATAGYAGALTNTFTVGIAQQIAGLPACSGIALRVVLFLVLEAVSMAYVMIIAYRIRKDPKASTVYAYDAEYNRGKRIDTDVVPRMSKRQVLVMIVFLLGIIISIVGVIKWEFYIDELSAVFLATGLIGGLVGGRKAGEIGDDFLKGCKDMMLPCVMIGLANAILVLLRDAHVLDTILYAMDTALNMITERAVPVGMFIFHELFNVAVPSGSAQAVATMPLMIPLAEQSGITRQTAVLAFQLGDAFTNVMVPTGGEILAALAICRIPFRKWVKYLFPLFIVWCVIAVCFIMYATMTGYGPM